MSALRRFAAVFPSFLLALSLNVAARAPMSPANELQAVRALAHRVKTAEQQARHGESIASSHLDSLAADLRHLEAAASSAFVAQKLRAIDVQLAQVRQLLSEETPTMAASVPASSRVDTDIEIVTPKHGGNCRNALGISPGQPVRLTLGKAGSNSAEAWLRIKTHGGEYAGFATDSDGPDPAMTLFSDCDSRDRSLAENDDALGLDAAAAARAKNSDAVYARIRNTGDAGTVAIDAVTTLTTISGQITDAESGEPIYNAHVTVHLGNPLYGNLIIYGSANTNSSGSYLVLLPSNQGDLSTYVRVDEPSYVAMLYPDGPCPFGSNSSYIDGCTFAPTSLVNVGVGSSVTGIDMALSKGLQISGMVTDKVGNPVDATIEITNASGSVLGVSGTNASSAYTFRTITPGSYKFRARNGDYRSQLYNHVDCTGADLQSCDFATATPLNIVDQDATGINFEMTKLASIGVSVTDDADQPILSPGGFPYVFLLNAYGRYITQGYGDDLDVGHFVAGPLSSGSYYVLAGASGYFSQLYPGIECAADCGPELASATPIVISGPEQTENATFFLHHVPIVRGHVRDAASNAPLANVTIVATTFGPGTQYTATTDESGDFSLESIDPGTYYMVAVSDDHIDMIHPSIQCQFYPIGSLYLPNSCNPAGATLLTIEPGQTPPFFDFALDHSSRLSGHVSIRTTLPADLPASAYVTLVDKNGLAVATASTDSTGNYAIEDLVQGTYYAFADHNGVGAESAQVWQSADCDATCFPLTGTPIQVGSNSEVAGINFDLPLHDAILGRLTDTKGAPIPQAMVELFMDSSGNFSRSATSDDDGYYAATGSVGYGYIVATDAGSGYINQVHQGIVCAYATSLMDANCSSAGATSIGLVSWSAQSPIVNFVLSSSDPLFRNGFEQ